MIEPFQAVVRKRGIESGMQLIKQEGMHMGHALKICKKAFGIGLGDAKRMIYSSPSWRSDVESVQPLIDIFEQVLAEHQA